jgi:hypothetical protein
VAFGALASRASTTTSCGPGKFYTIPVAVERTVALDTRLLSSLFMKTQHALTVVAMVLMTPILFGLGSFMVIPLILLAVAVLPIMIIGGIVMFVAWHRASPGSPRIALARVVALRVRSAVDRTRS